MSTDNDIYWKNWTKEFGESLDELGDSIQAFAKCFFPEGAKKHRNDEKGSPPVAAGSKEFIDYIPDPRLRQVYRRRMRATDRRTD